MIACRLRSTIAREDLLIVLLPYKSFQHSIDLIDIQRDWGLRILGVEGPIGICIAIALHTVNLIVRPAVHAQRLDFRDVGAQFAM